MQFNVDVGEPSFVDNGLRSDEDGSLPASRSVTEKSKQKEVVQQQQQQQEQEQRDDDETQMEEEEEHGESNPFRWLPAYFFLLLLCTGLGSLPPSSSLAVSNSTRNPDPTRPTSSPTTNLCSNPCHHSSSTTRRRRARPHSFLLPGIPNPSSIHGRRRSSPSSSSSSSQEETSRISRTKSQQRSKSRRGQRHRRRRRRDSDSDSNSNSKSQVEEDDYCYQSFVEGKRNECVEGRKLQERIKSWRRRRGNECCWSWEGKGEGEEEAGWCCKGWGGGDGSEEGF